MSHAMSRYVRFAGAVSALALTAAAHAQEGGFPIVEEIIVTAQKREQSVLDVPITITSYSGDFLQSLNISEFDQLSNVVPGLVVQEQSPNNPGFVIRGITSDSGDSQIAPRITVYENGFDVSRSRGSFFELFDLERVEVVKGPQATLFGTAALIGAVSVITAKPQQELSAAVEASYGNFDFVQARGFITGGNDLVQGRLAVSYRRRDGFVENIAGEPGSQTPGGPAIADLNGLEVFAIRPSIRFTPGDRFVADFVFNYQQEDPPATAFKSGVLAPTGGSTDPFSFAELSGSPFSEEVLGDELGLDRRRYTANLTMTYDVNEAITVTSISGYLNFDSLEVFDADGSPAFLLEFAEDAVGEVISQEFRANYAGNRLNGFIGVNWYHEEGSQGVPFSTDETIFAACIAPNPANDPSLLTDPATAAAFEPNAFAITPFCQNPDGSINRIDVVPTSPSFMLPVPVNGPAGVPIPYAAAFTNTANLDTVSVFADLSYRLFDRLELTGGIRYIYEDREGGFIADAPNSQLLGTPLLPVVSTGGVELTGQEDFDAIVGRFNALYQFTETINGYVTVGRGRRSPVVEVDSAFDPMLGVIPNVNIIEDEIVWNYEGGIKANLGNGRLVLDAAIFYQDYSDFQTTINTPDGFTSVTAGDATNIGVEVGLQGQLTEFLSYFANAAFTEGEIDDDPENGIFAGTQFRLQPRWTASAGLFWDQPVTSTLRVFGNVSWSYRSDVFFEQENLPIAGLPIAEDDVNLVGIRGGIGGVDGGWEISGFASNLTNTDYIIDAGNTGGVFGTPTFIAGPPRFFGVELRTRF
ncbi:MAG: TonB-dependent receptor [Rhodothalassiaceae bacterium]